jgi:hypothetical protein
LIHAIWFACPLGLADLSVVPVQQNNTFAAVLKKKQQLSLLVRPESG